MQGARGADESWKALSAAPSGNESECGAAMAEDGMRPSNAVTAGQSEIEAPTHAVAANGRDGRCGEFGDGPHEALTHMGEAKRIGAVQAGDLEQVGSGGKEVRVTGDDEAGGVLPGEDFKGLGECEDTRARQSIGAVGGNETQDGRIVEGFDCL